MLSFAWEEATEQKHQGLFVDKIITHSGILRHTNID
jgi:hypothetical protein